MMFCTIFHDVKIVKNTHGGVLYFTKLQASVSIFTKSDAPSWGVFHVF